MARSLGPLPSRDEKDALDAASPALTVDVTAENENGLWAAQGVLVDGFEYMP